MSKELGKWKRVGTCFLLSTVIWGSGYFSVRAENTYCYVFDEFIVSDRYNVNIRREPSMDSEIIAETYPDQILENLGIVEGDVDIEGNTNLWYMISLGEEIGYTKYDYYLHGDELQEYLLQTERVYADIRENTETVVYPTTEESGGRVYFGPTGEQYQVIFTWNGKLELEGFGFVDQEACELTLISSEEKDELEEILLEADRTEMLVQEGEGNDSDRLEHPELFEEPNVLVGETSEIRTRIVEEALNYVGLPYVWGGTSLSQGVDCSGFTMRIYEGFGIGIGRTSRQQAVTGREVDPANMQPGDLVFYADETGTIGHVVMYIGNGQCVHARSEEYGVIVQNLWSGYAKVVSYLD